MRRNILLAPRHQYYHWSQQLNNEQRSTLCTKTNSMDYGSDNKLPQEILTEIFSYFIDQPSILYQVSLVCSQWFSSAIPLLYKDVKLNSTYPWAIYMKTVSRGDHFLPYGNLTKSLDLSYFNLEHALKAESILDKYGPPQFNNRQMDTSTEIDTMVQKLHDALLKYSNWPGLLITTSSLLQLSGACRNLITLNLSDTRILPDFLVAETGDYISELQHDAIPSGLTFQEINLEAAIEAIGCQCQQLERLELQNCDWVTNRIIWVWALTCPNLTYLDARFTFTDLNLTSKALQVKQKSPQNQQTLLTSSTATPTLAPKSPTASAGTSTSHQNHFHYLQITANGSSTQGTSSNPLVHRQPGRKLHVIGEYERYGAANQVDNEPQSHRDIVGWIWSVKALQHRLEDLNEYALQEQHATETDPQLPEADTDNYSTMRELVWSKLVALKKVATKPT